jgi:O-antigen chain-terminating methyltransferase
MIETPNPEINVDDIMAKIRLEIAERNKTESPEKRFDFWTGGNGDAALREVELKLKMAEENWEVGIKQLPLMRFPKSVRWLAHLVAGMILYLTQIITIPQRFYNQAILEGFRALLVGVRSHLADIETQTRRHLIEIETELNQIRSSVSAVRSSVSALKNSQVSQDHRLRKLLDEVREVLPDSALQKKIQTVVEESAAEAKEYLYISFEDHFRGERQDIKERLAYYIPIVRKANAGSKENIMVDAGCGRGEWLELLKNEGLFARGVDINRMLVEFCTENGLDAVQAEIVDYLQTLKDNSIGAVTAFHLIEHLPYEVCLRFFDESLRVLKPGGLVIYETPNPENIQVGACNFYFDPTHRNPLPAKTVKFLAESSGFTGVTLHFLHPLGKEHQIEDDGTEIVRRFNQLFYGPRDYALVGYKA